MRPEHQGFRPGESALTPDSLPQISRWNIAYRITILVAISLLISNVQSRLIREYRESARPPVEPITRGYVLTCATIRTAGRPRADAHLQYRYSVGGNNFTVETVVSGSTCTPFLPNSSVNVHYNERTPADSQLDLGRIEASAEIGNAILFPALISLVLVWDMVNMTTYIGTYYRTVQKFDILRSTTSILDGNIDRAGLGQWFSISYLYNRLARSKHIYVSFHFESPAGKTLRGKQVFDWPTDREVPKRGTSVKILYASDDAYLLL